jgi:tetratricopeptide (TPR) repeat protein
MFDNRYAVRPASNKWSAGRIVSLIAGLVLINVVFLVIRPFDNACTSWLSSNYDRAVALDLYGDKKAAIAAYSADLKWSPQHVEALKGRGQDYAALGQLDLAVADLTQAAQLAPHDWDVLADRAEVYQSRGEFDRAIADMTQAARLQPDIWSNWKTRGDIYLAHGDLDAAIADYTRSLDVGGDNKVDVALYPRGIAYLRTGHYALASADFTAYAAAHFNEADAVAGRDCATARSNTGACAIAYPTPPDPMTQRLLDAGARSLSGCE